MRNNRHRFTEKLPWHAWSRLLSSSTASSYIDPFMLCIFSIVFFYILRIQGTRPIKFCGIIEISLTRCLDKPSSLILCRFFIALFGNLLDRSAPVNFCRILFPLSHISVFACRRISVTYSEAAKTTPQVIFSSLTYSNFERRFLLERMIFSVFLKR